jgi:hypothetical protein
MSPQIAHASSTSQEDQAFSAYANSRYEYCDAKMVAALWGLDVYAGKLRIGNKILYGIADIVEEDLTNSRQRGNSCNFNETGFSYRDARRLSNAWGGRLSVWDAKTKIAAFVTAGQSSQIRAQMNNSRSHADQQLYGNFHIRQRSSGRYLDAKRSTSDAMTRPFQNNQTQNWQFTPLGNNVFTIKQISTGLFLDAYHKPFNLSDFSAVTRAAQYDASQRWIIHRVFGNTYSIQQQISGRYLEAYEGTNDNSALTSAYRSNARQLWTLERAP